MKCNRSRAGFELISPCPFPMTIIITSRTPPKVAEILIVDGFLGTVPKRPGKETERTGNHNFVRSVKCKNKKTVDSKVNYISLLLNSKTREEGVLRMLDCGIIVSEFELQSRYYVHFQKNTLGLYLSYGLNSTTTVLLEEWLWH